MTDLLREPDIGEKVTGRVMEVSAHALLMDIGAKQEAYLPASEFGRLGKRARVNDEFDVLVYDRDKNTDQFIVSRRLVEEGTLWQDLDRDLKAGTPREAKVIQVLEKGLLVDLGNVRAFLPRSQIALKPVQDLSSFADQTLQCLIIEVDPQRKRVIVSRRPLLEKEEEERKKKALAQIEVGKVYKAVVRRIVKFGAFVDIMGLDCLLHASEMGFSPNIDPHKMVKVGQEIEVKVLSKDEERGRVSVSRKQILPDPWEDAGKRYKVGTVTLGKVTNLVNYGAFVRLEDGIEGLVHNSEISDEPGVTAQKKLKKGETVRVRILEIDPEARRIRLTMKPPKEAEAPPEYLGQKETRYTLGALTGLSEVFKDSTATTSASQSNADRPATEKEAPPVQGSPAEEPPVEPAVSESGGTAESSYADSGGTPEPDSESRE